MKRDKESGMKRWLWYVFIFDLTLVCGGLLLLGGEKTERADLRVITALDVSTFDPQRMSWLSDLRVAECLFERLTLVDPATLKVVSAAAKSWEVSDDARSYTFHLRKNAKWSNGDAVTAHDFKYAWKRGLYPEFSSGYTMLFYCIEGAKGFFDFRVKQMAELAKIKDNAARVASANVKLKEAEAYFDKHVGIEVVDELTLKVKLARVTPYFLQLTAFITYAPMNRDAVEKFVALRESTGGLYQQSDWSKPGSLVSNGAYILAQHRFKRDLLLKSNNHYWDIQSVKNKSIRFRVVQDMYTSLKMYESGDADWLPDISSGSSLAARLAKEQREGKRDDIDVRTSAGTYFYIFNCSPKMSNGNGNPLADKRVRQALSLAINRKLIATKIVKIQPEVAASFTPGNAIPGYQPPIDMKRIYDIEKAKSLLEDAGYGEVKAVEGLSILYNNEGEHKLIAQQIANNWESVLGVEVRLEGVEKGSFSDRVQRQDFTVARTSWFGDYRDPTTFLDRFKAGDNSNDGKYASDKFDLLMGKAEIEIDKVKRFALLSAAEEVMLEDQAIAPIYHFVVFNVFDPKRVKGMFPNTWQFRSLKDIAVEK